MTIMNLDYYYYLFFFFFCNTLQQASIVSTIRRSFFSSWRGQYGKQKNILHIRTYAHSHTHARAHNTTHHSSKSISGFFLLFVLFVFWHTTTTTTTITTTRQCRSLCCFVSISVCHVDFYYYLWPSSDTQELNSRCTKQRPITTKKGKGENFHCMEYKKENRRHISTHTQQPRAAHAPHIARLCNFLRI